MNRPGRTLQNTQGWMQAVITNPSGIHAGITSSAAQKHVEISPDQISDIVAESGSLAASERLAIYGNAYFARIQECLRAEFPALLHALGTDLFSRFTFDYIHSYPSRSYTLDRLGENFPRYLADTRPDSEALSGERESWPDFIIDLARIERAFSEVFDGPGFEGRTSPQADQQSTDSQLLERTYFPAVCFRLFDFRYPVHQYFDAVRHGKDTDLLAPAGNFFLAITRRDYVVRFYELSPDEHALLKALLSGQTLAQVIEGSKSADEDHFSAKALAWVRAWLDKGFFGDEYPDRFDGVLARQAVVSE